MRYGPSPPAAWTSSCSTRSRSAGFVCSRAGAGRRTSRRIVRTRSCQLRHVGYVMSGSLQVTMDDGTELVIGRGDGYEIPPGHEVRVIGDEPWESVEFASAHMFGLAPEELGERVLATVIFTDIVGSTAQLERPRRPRVGERAPRAQRQDPRGDRSLPRPRGRVHRRRLSRPLRRRLAGGPRRGAHGSGGRGARRDLLDGSGLSLESRGEHELKGLSGARTIFALRR